MHDLDEEPLNALLQVQLTRSARDKLQREAKRQHLKLSVLARAWLLDRLDTITEEEPG